MCKFHASARGVPILRIERIQNPHLYQCYMVRKQKIDKDIGGDSERQLFHGAEPKNVNVKDLTEVYVELVVSGLHYCSVK